MLTSHESKMQTCSGFRLVFLLRSATDLRPATAAFHYSEMLHECNAWAFIEKLKYGQRRQMLFQLTIPASTKLGRRSPELRCRSIMLERCPLCLFPRIFSNVCHDDSVLENHLHILHHVPISTFSDLSKQFLIVCVLAVAHSLPSNL